MAGSPPNPKAQNHVVCTYDEGMQHLFDFIKIKDNSRRFALLMQEGDEYKYYTRINQPCYGELREYVEGEYRPGDLYYPFPKGNPVAVCVPFIMQKGGNTKDQWNKLLSFILSDESPWRSVFKSRHVTEDAEGWVNGIVIDDTNIDPTVMVNLFRVIANRISNTYNTFDFITTKYPNMSLRETFIIASMIYVSGEKLYINTSESDVITGNPIFANVYNCTPVDVNDNGDHTFYGRTRYNRVKNDHIWGIGKQSLAVQFGVASRYNAFLPVSSLDDVIAAIRKSRDSGV